MAALRALLDAASAASRLLIQDALGLMLRPDSMVLGTRGERCKWRRWLAHHSMLAAAAAWTALLDFLATSRTRRKHRKRFLAKKPPNNLTPREGLARWKPRSSIQWRTRRSHSYAGAKGLMLGDKYDSY
jgi:hypothetical protein